MRIIPRNRLPRKCPDCGERMVKGGITSNNKQLWRCKNPQCGRQTIRPIISR